MTVSVVQERQSAASATGTTIALAYSSALTPGNALHAAGSNDTGGGVNVSSCAATTNGTFGAALDNINDAINAQRLAHWALANIGSGVADTITVTFSATTTFRGIWIKEIGGCSASPLDGNTGQNQAGSTGTDAISSGNATNANQPALLSSFTLNTGTAGSTITQGTGFTLGATDWNTIYGGNQVQAASESKRITSSGVGVASTYTTGTTVRMVTVQAIFDEASSSVAQTDWPNPNLGKPYPQILRGWIQDPLPAPNAIPIHQSEWPNPTLRVPNHELRVWIQDPIPAPNAIPIHQSDWPNPAPLPPNKELRSWIEAPIPAPQSIPPRQSDWPNPAPLPPNKELRSWIEAPQPAPNPIPNAQRDWPNPGIPKRSIDGLSWSWSFAPAVVAAAPPFGPYDWPNPVVARVGSYDELRTWVQGVVGPSSTNFAQYDWPNPLLAKRSIDALTWISSNPPAALPPPPFAQYDWPNPVIARSNPDLRGWIQSPLPAPQPFAIAQYDWPNPQLIRYNGAIYFWSSSPRPAAVVAPIGLHEIGLGFGFGRFGGRVGGN